MSEEDRRTRLEREIEQLLRAMDEEGVAGGTISKHGVVSGQPNWEERTKDQRFAEKVKTHGYPLGLAKSTHWKRDRLIATLQDRVSHMDQAERSVHEASHEAIAWALYAERFLGSFNRGERGGFPVETVDEVADHILVWLEERGFGVTPLQSAVSATQPIRGAVLFIDIFSGMILDKPTHHLYEQVQKGELALESARETRVMNELAAQWCRSLRLSRLYDGESPPPTGKVGQYGRYGCVLMESASNESVVMQDVCVFSYEPKRFGRFIKELVKHRFVKLVRSKVTNTDVVEHISGLHTVSRFELGVELDSDLSEVERKTDVAAAIAWGRQHAKYITAHE